MRFYQLSTSLVVGLGFWGLSAHAAWLNNNLRDGTALRVSFSASPSLSTNSQKFTYLYNDPSIYNRYDNNGNLTKAGVIEDVLADQDRKTTDERARLNGFGSATVYLSASKVLTRNVKAYGETWLWGIPNGDETFAWRYGLGLYHDKYGSVSFGSNYSFLTNNVEPSNVYSVLDKENLSISANYKYIPNMNISAYYAFPSATNLHDKNDTGLRSGQGISVSYSHAFAPRHILEGGIGYTTGKRHVELSSDTVAKYKKAKALGLKYQYQDWQLSANIGRADENFDGDFLEKSQTDIYGLNLSYDITPRVNAYVSYGESESKKKGSNNQEFTFDLLTNNYLGVQEQNLFDKVERQYYGIGASYQLYTGIALRASANQEKTTNYLVDGAFSERKNTYYGIGMSFNF